MKLHFSLEYHTHWGEDLRVEITLHRSRGTIVHYVCQLDTQDGRFWWGDIQLSDRDVKFFDYRYFVAHGEQVVRREWNGVPRSFPYDSQKSFIFPDYWKDIPLLSHLYSSAYSHCVSHFHERQPELPYFQKTLVFRVQAPQLKAGQALALVGSHPSLGGWAPGMALRMCRGGVHEWCLSLSAEALQFPFEYKYVVVDEQSGEIIAWEGGENRHSPYREVESQQVVVIYDQRVRIQEEHWKTAGVVIPVFSLRSEKSQGVGDFGDLSRMVDWAGQTGMRVIQILPIYDTTQTRTWTDSYPYNSISIYALHPMYIDLGQLAPIEDKKYMKAYEQRRKELNALPQVDYEAVTRLKEDYLRHLYAQEGEAVLNSPEYTAFYQTNEDWLIPYAAFCYLRDEYGTCDFVQWPSYSQYDAADVHRLADTRRIEIGYYCYLQYYLDKQLSATTRYARSHGVLLKGDIPIGISPHSVEAWVEPHYFHMNGQAGAPPDDFSANGQNWGFPTYDWARMAQDGYQWWIRRFQKMAQYFDAYRIDHVLGFFRIWEIPMHSVHGLLGQFAPAMPMSVQEIESYGLPFRREFFTQPYITGRVLSAIFGDRVGEVRDTYLCPIGVDLYAMRPEFSTQRQVEVAFAGRTTEQDIALREGLYSLISNVLFVPDHNAPETYHPRISAVDDYLYASLPANEQEAFRRLYEDYFYRRHNAYWYAEAMKKLPVLVEATRMLVCAEDLGMVPACVGPVMDELRMLSLEIQAMPKQIGVRFGRIEENPYRSVATIFTHDMATLRGWWDEDIERTQHYFNEVLQHDGQAPHPMPDWLCEEVVARHLYSPSMLCLISLQDWLSMDERLRYSDPDAERINIPANPRHYWRYRMHLTIENLCQQVEFNLRIRTLICRGGRQ